MKAHQKGEAVVSIMIVMVVAMWLSTEHVGSVDHGDDHAKKPESSRQHTGSEHSRHDRHDEHDSDDD